MFKMLSSNIDKMFGFDCAKLKPVTSFYNKFLQQVFTGFYNVYKLSGCGFDSCCSHIAIV